jgi:hypothetical protein
VVDPKAPCVRAIFLLSTPFSTVPPKSTVYIVAFLTLSSVLRDLLFATLVPGLLFCRSFVLRALRRLNGLPGLAELVPYRLFRVHLHGEKINFFVSLPVPL